MLVFGEGKILSFEMDDDWGYPYSRKPPYIYIIYIYMYIYIAIIPISQVKVATTSCKYQSSRGVLFMAQFGTANQ